MPKIPRPSNSNSGLQSMKAPKGLPALLSLMSPVPDDWLIPAESSNRHAVTMDCVNCHDYQDLITAWGRALKWTDGLDCALSVMLAASASTMLIGEQLWFKILGPPSSGKTTILEGLSVNKQYVFSKDSIRGFYQGWKSEDGSDLSIASLCKGKTLATKDGDTLLKTPNLQQILSEGRGLYDRVGRTHYRNSVMNDYEGHRMTWLLCGTNSLREIDESELGNRFLDCVVMDTIDDKFEDDVAWQAVNQEARSMLAESNGRPEGQYPEELAHAMAMTGGYLGHLRENVVELIAAVDFPQERLRECAKLGKFVAYLRARPHTVRDDAEVTREFSARLAKQHVRLANVLALTLNRNSIDDEVMRRVRKVACDTARGKTFAICNMLRNAENGMSVKAIEQRMGYANLKASKLLYFMKEIGATENFRQKTKQGVKGSVRWRLSRLMEELFSEAVPNDANYSEV